LRKIRKSEREKRERENDNNEKGLEAVYKYGALAAARKKV
jgi:hypothetical protein